MMLFWLLYVICPIQSLTLNLNEGVLPNEDTEVAYAHNCNCGNAVSKFATDRSTPQLCRNECEANSECLSFGVWASGECTLFDATCTPECPNPTAEGSNNDVYNLNADEESESNVIHWLQKLISEGQTEINDIRQAVEDKNTTLDALTSILHDAELILEEARIKLEEADKEVTSLSAECQTKTEDYYKALPGLGNEILVFNEVINQLNSGLNVDQNAAIAIAFISEEDQADPVKVAQAIKMIEDLRDASQNQIDILNATHVSCQIKLDTATTTQSEKEEEFNEAQNDVDTKQQPVTVAQAEYDTAAEYALHRIPVVEEEISNLDYVVSQISSLI